MASVLEMKELLAAQQEHAAKLTEKALQAIEATTSVGNLFLTILGIELAALAAIGVTAIYVGARRQAVKVAETRIKAYIASAEGTLVVRAAISDEITLQLERRSFDDVLPPAHEETETAKFPKDPKEEAGK